MMIDVAWTAAGKGTVNSGRELGPLPALDAQLLALSVFVILHRLSAKLLYAYQHL